MRKAAVNTGFDTFSVFLFYPVIAGTVHTVKGAVTKEAVYLLKSLVTRVILTFPVFKKSA